MTRTPEEKYDDVDDFALLTEYFQVRPGESLKQAVRRFPYQDDVALNRVKIILESAFIRLDPKTKSQVAWAAIRRAAKELRDARP